MLVAVPDVAEVRLAVLNSAGWHANSAFWSCPNSEVAVNPWAAHSQPQPRRWAHWLSIRRKIGINCSEGTQRSGLKDFHVVSVDANREGSFNSIYGDHQFSVSVVSDQDSFKSL